ncbi:MAG TPA: reverse transcriptase-like protein [Actinomycetota bacterium]|nr:reverse transcriptase-like protein [Actinomycetota bacterium]
MNTLWPEPPAEVVINCDGGSRGNPGPAAYGCSIQTPDGQEIEGIGETIGIATNNVAEYSAVIAGLRRVAEIGARAVHVRSDSKLLIEQLSGRWKIKNPGLKELHKEAIELARGFDRVTYEHVRREQNVRADELVNLALDGLL